MILGILEGLRMNQQKTYPLVIIYSNLCIAHQIRMQKYNEKQVKIASSIPDPATEFNPYFDIKSEISRSSKTVILQTSLIQKSDEEGYKLKQKKFLRQENEPIRKVFICYLTPYYSPNTSISTQTSTSGRIKSTKCGINQRRISLDKAMSQKTSVYTI